MRTNLRAAAMLVVTVMALGACKASVTVTSNDTGSGGGAYNTYNDNGVTFQYPSSWQELSPASMGAQTGNQAWSATFGPSAGTNVVVITAYTLPVNITPANVDQIKGQVASAIDKIAQQASGDYNGSLSPTTMGGFPAFQADFTVAGDGGQSLQSSAIVAFNGKTEYFLLCQYDASAKSDVTAACDQIKGSFKTTSG